MKAFRENSTDELTQRVFAVVVTLGGPFHQPWIPQPNSEGCNSSCKFTDDHQAIIFEHKYWQFRAGFVSEPSTELNSVHNSEWGNPTVRIDTVKRRCKIRIPNVTAAILITTVLHCTIQLVNGPREFKNRFKKRATRPVQLALRNEIHHFSFCIFFSTRMSTLCTLMAMISWRHSDLFSWRRALGKVSKWNAVLESVWAVVPLYYPCAYISSLTGNEGIPDWEWGVFVARANQGVKQFSCSGTLNILTLPVFCYLRADWTTQYHRCASHLICVSSTEIIIVYWT